MTNLNTTLRTYGVELEFTSSISIYEMARLITVEVLAPMGMDCSVASYTDKSNTWRLKPDCSIRGMNGMELVTPILRGEQDMVTLKKVVAICEQYGSVNRTCGMHVHIGIADASKNNLRSLLYFLAKYEHAINGIISPSRRGSSNRYCSDSFPYEANLWGVYNGFKMTNTHTLLGTGYFGGRGKWNFRNFWQHGTFENRAHQGTLDVEKIENWVRFTQAIVERAFKKRAVTTREHDTTTTYGTEYLLKDLRNGKFISNVTAKFYKQRSIDLN